MTKIKQFDTDYIMNKVLSDHSGINIVKMFSEYKDYRFLSTFLLFLVNTFKRFHKNKSLFSNTKYF